ncbi:MAG: response regulator [Chitinophagales bacterium]
MGSKILIVDDDQNICDLIRLYLDSEGYELLFANDGSAALDCFRDEEPDLIILDIMLPIINGQDVCKLIRARSPVPIIMVTARDSTTDKIQGLDCGADDYIVKPFDPMELCARVRARLRRMDSSNDSNTIVLGDLELDPLRFEVRVGGKDVSLKPREVNLLHFLLKNKNMVFTREQLLDKVWGYDYSGETRTVDVHIRRLREKLGSSKKWEIKTVWGIGYKLEDKHR